MKFLAPALAAMLLVPAAVPDEHKSPSDAPVLDDATVEASAADEPAPGALVISRGEGRAPIVVPRDERLVFDVSLELGVLGSPKIGEVAIITKVDPFHSLGGPESEARQLERGTITAIAVGQYALYEVRDELSTQILPQAWPQFIYRKVQTGSENRRRELRIGDKEGVSTASYRSDTHCKGCRDKQHFVSSRLPWKSDFHCEGCSRARHRIWNDYRSREVPPEAIDMLSATLVARAMIADSETDAVEQIDVLSKLHAWKLLLSRGVRKRQEVRAGEFDSVLVVLEAQRPEGEEDDGRDFSGLFGIHGSISMWFDAATGVPVLIAGKVPAGPITLDVRIELKSFEGTPPGFRAR